MPMPHGFSGEILAVCTGEAGDAGALKAASRLASTAGTALRIISVIENDPGDDLMRAIAGPEPEAIHAARRDERREAVAAAMAEAGLDGAGAEIEITAGKTFQEIIRHAVREDCSMIVKAASHPGRLHRLLLGSEDLHLVRKSPVPVWILREGLEAGADEVLAAVDFGPDAEGSESSYALNTRILETACGMALCFGARLRLVHVWQAPAEGLLQRAAPGVTHAQLEDYVRRVAARHQASLDALCDEAEAVARTMAATDFTVGSLLERGDARDLLPGIANRVKPLALVMGTVSRTGIPGLFIGNTAEDVLLALEGSVVAVKPPGFETPVKL